MTGKRFRADWKATRERKDLIALARTEITPGSFFIAGAYLSKPTAANARSIHWTERDRRHSIWLSPTELTKCHAQAGGVAVCPKVRERMTLCIENDRLAEEESRRLG